MDPSKVQEPIPHHYNMNTPQDLSAHYQTPTNHDNMANHGNVASHGNMETHGSNAFMNDLKVEFNDYAENDNSTALESNIESDEASNNENLNSIVVPECKFDSNETYTVTPEEFGGVKPFACVLPRTKIDKKVVNHSKKHMLIFICEDCSKGFGQIVNRTLPFDKVNVVPYFGCNICGQHLNRCQMIKCVLTNTVFNDLTAYEKYWQEITKEENIRTIKDEHLKNLNNRYDVLKCAKCKIRYVGPTCFRKHDIMGQSCDDKFYIGTMTEEFQNGEINEQEFQYLTSAKAEGFELIKNLQFREDLSKKNVKCGDCISCVVPKQRQVKVKKRKKPVEKAKVGDENKPKQSAAKKPRKKKNPAVKKDKPSFDVLKEKFPKDVSSVQQILKEPAYIKSKQKPDVIEAKVEEQQTQEHEQQEVTHLRHGPANTKGKLIRKPLPKVLRCGTCENCVRARGRKKCGSCTFCRNKALRKACKYERCLNPISIDPQTGAQVKSESGNAILDPDEQEAMAEMQEQMPDVPYEDIGSSKRTKPCLQCSDCTNPRKFRCTKCIYCRNPEWNKNCKYQKCTNPIEVDPAEEARLEKVESDQHLQDAAALLHQQIPMHAAPIRVPDSAAAAAMVSQSQVLPSIEELQHSKILAAQPAAHLQQYAEQQQQVQQQAQQQAAAAQQQAAQHQQHPQQIQSHPPPMIPPFMQQYMQFQNYYSRNQPY